MRILKLGLSVAFLMPMLLSPGFAQNGVQQFAELGQCKLKSGQVIENCRIGYRTFGSLNAAQARQATGAYPTYGSGQPGPTGQSPADVEQLGYQQSASQQPAYQQPVYPQQPAYQQEPAYQQ